MMLKGLFHNLPNIVTVLIFKPSPVNNCFIVNVHAVSTTTIKLRQNKNMQWFYRNFIAVRSHICDKTTMCVNGRAYSANASITVVLA